MLLRLYDHISNQHHQEHYWADDQPACLPKDVGPPPSHEVDVVTETVRGHGQFYFIRIVKDIPLSAEFY